MAIIGKTDLNPSGLLSGNTLREKMLGVMENYRTVTSNFSHIKWEFNTYNGVHISKVDFNDMSDDVLLLYFENIVMTNTSD